jgi:hypothetical protein
MKKYIFELSVIFFTLLIMTGCSKKYPIEFDPAMSIVGFSKTALSINENGVATPVNIYLGAKAGQTATDVTLTVSSAGLKNPAVEGTDYTISSKTLSVGVGVSSVNIVPINNDVFQGNKQFYLIIASNSKGYTITDQDTLTVTLIDDEHPLKAWIGSYTVAAASYGDPGNWDEVWNVTTTADPSNVNNLLVYGIGTSSPSTTKWTGVVNMTAMTITFSAGQQLDNAYGYGPVLMYLGTSGGATIKDQNIVGTIAANGSIHIDHVGIELTGSNAGYVWDVFNTTWTKK